MFICQKDTKTPFYIIFECELVQGNIRAELYSKVDVNLRVQCRSEDGCEVLVLAKMKCTKLTRKTVERLKRMAGLRPSLLRKLLKFYLFFVSQCSNLNLLGPCQRNVFKKKLIMIISGVNVYRAP